MVRTTTLTEEDLKQLRVLEEQDGNPPPMEVEETIGRMASLTHGNDHDIVTLPATETDQNDAEAPQSSIVSPTVYLEELGIVLGDQKGSELPVIEMVTPTTTMIEQLKELGILERGCREETTTVAEVQDEEHNKLPPDFALNAPRPDGNDTVSLPFLDEERKKKESLSVLGVHETVGDDVIANSFEGDVNANNTDDQNIEYDEQLYAQVETIVTLYDAGAASSDDNNETPPNNIMAPTTVDLEELGIVLRDQKETKPSMIEMVTTKTTTKHEHLPKEMGILEQGCHEEITTLASSDLDLAKARDKENSKPLPDFALNAPRPEGNDTASLPCLNEERKEKVSLGVMMGVRLLRQTVCCGEVMANSLDEARHYFKQAVLICKQVTCGFLRLANEFEEAGYSSINKKNWELALCYFQQAISLYKQKCPDFLSLAYYALESAGWVCCKQNQWADALCYYKQAISIFERKTKGSLDLAQTVDGAACFCSNQNQWAEAICYYKQAISMQEQKVPNSLNLAHTLHNAGWVCSNQNQWAEALCYYKQAISIQEQKVPESLDLAHTLQSAGWTCSNQNQWTDALCYYKQAFSIRDQKAPDSLDLAQTLDDTGWVCLNQGEWADALRYYKQAISILEQKAPDSLDLAHTLHNAGWVCFSQNEWDSALRYYKQAISILEQKAPDSLDLAHTFHNAGNVCCKLKEWEDALCYFKLAIPIREQKAADPLDLSHTFHQAGYVCCKLQQWHDALCYSKLAVTIYERKAADSLYLALTYSNLGWCSCQQGRLYKALCYYKQSLPVYLTVAKRRLNKARLSTYLKRISCCDPTPIHTFFQRLVVCKRRDYKKASTMAVPDVSDCLD